MDLPTLWGRQQDELQQSRIKRRLIPTVLTMRLWHYGMVTGVCDKGHQVVDKRTQHRELIRVFVFCTVLQIVFRVYPLSCVPVIAGGGKKKNRKEASV